MPRAAMRQGAGKPSAAAARKRPVVSDDAWDADSDDGSDAGVEWLEITTRERETSRIRRQMEARRELEKRMEEKRLRNLVEDWAFED